jgi:hypothetical protein
MPRYLFFFRSATEKVRDEEGEDLPDDAAAHAAAAQTARELEGPGFFSQGTVAVETEDGRFVTEVPVPAVRSN